MATRRRSLSDLIEVAPADEDGRLNVVVETPRGSRFKVAYDDDLRAFAFQHMLPMGVAYPYDWGFLPRTRGQDGDPLDALVLHDEATFPGCVVACRLLGVVRLTEKGGGEGRLENDRFILRPADCPRFAALKDVSEETRDEIEHFFGSIVLSGKKMVRVEAWQGEKKARRLIDDARRAYRRRRGT